MLYSIDLYFKYVEFVLTTIKFIKIKDF